MTKLDIIGERSFGLILNNLSWLISVQFGGIVGLFLGASILSLLEILFLVYDAFKKKFK